ncbi:hypothetical protein [Micromonospora sp. DT233]|uniref:hypothetical protein n=1 Tax=Micromonospora sp. DT233 TaxID=3393432 RepID=UPI003CE88EEB
MTPQNNTPTFGGEPHVRHRLLPPERLAAAYDERWRSPAVSAYALAVRAVIEDCPEIGPVNTWSRLAERICQGRPGRDRDVWRKKLSRHFAPELKGPPWQTVEMIVRYVVPESEREATLGRFKRLHDAAREGSPRKGCNPGRFPAGTSAAQYLPAGPSPTNHAPAGRRRATRLDQVWATSRPAGPLSVHHQVDPLPYAPDGARRR